MEKKSSKNFPICRPKPSKSESKRGQNGEKIVQKFHILSTKTIKKLGPKNAKIPKNYQFVDQNRQKSDEKSYKNDDFQR